MADLLFLNPEDCVLDFQPLDSGLNHFGSIRKPNGGSRGEARVGGGGGGRKILLKPCLVKATGQDVCSQPTIILVSSFQINQKITKRSFYSPFVLI